MKLAIVSLMDGQSWGGSEIMWSKLADLALSEGDEVLLSLFRWPNTPKVVHALQQKGALVSFRERYHNNERKFSGLWSRLVRKLSKGKRPYRSIIAFKPDHVFISQGGSFDLTIHHEPLYYLLKAHGIDYSLMCHGHFQYSDLPSQHILTLGRKIFQDASNVFLVSDKQRNMIERYLSLNLSNSKFTFNPLSLSIPEASLNYPESEIIQFAMVASLVSGKGHDTLFEIMSNSFWHSKKWKLNVYGEGYGLYYLKKLAEFLNISEKVQFHGYVDNVVSIWEKNHILLIPSSGEGMPISLVEAMFCGRTVVAADVGGISELIEHTYSGFIAPAPSGKSLSETMHLAYSYRKEWREMGLRGREEIEKRFQRSPEADIYNEIKKLARCQP